MSDCSSGGGEFQDKYGWTHELRHALIKDLIGIICGYKVALFGCAVDVPEYKELPSVDGRDRLGKSHYHLAFQAMIEIACNNALMDKLPLNESVAFFLDRNAKHEYWAEEFHKAIQSDDRLSWRNRVGSLTFGSRAETIPLQVGDLGAFEAMKEAARFFGHHDRSKRRSLERLIESERVWVIKCYDKRSMEIILRLKQESLGLIPPPG